MARDHSRRGASLQGRGRGRGRGRGDQSTVVYRPVAPQWLTSASSSASEAQETVSREFERKMEIRAPVTKTLARPPPERKSPAPAPASSVTLARRPSFGTVGTRTRIKANHFPVKLSYRDIHRYNVTITPAVTSVDVKREIISELFRIKGKTNFNGLKPAYDGMQTLYTAKALPFNSDDFVVWFVDIDEAEWIRDELKYNVNIKYTSKIAIQHLRDYKKLEKDELYQLIQVLDAVLHDSLSDRLSNCKVIGRSFYTAYLGNPVAIGGGVQCWRGINQSLRPTQMGISLNADVSTTSFYAARVRLHEFVKDFLNLRATSLSCSYSLLSDRQWSELDEVLRGVRVIATHEEARCYTITKLSNQPTDQLKFLEDGREKSAVSYFKERYGIKLNYDSWPLLQSGSDTEPIYLPMETCLMVEGQRYIKKLNKTAFLREACKPPSYREKKIQMIANLNPYKEGHLAYEFGIYVKREFTCFDARVLPAPTLKYHDSGKDRTITPHLGQWNVDNARMFRGATVRFWRCMNFSSLPEDMASRFCRDLVEMCCNKGMDITPNPMAPILSVEPHQIEDALVDAHHMCREESKPLELLIIILPDISGFYGKIKRICDTELGIITQCCQPEQAKNCNPQYLQNVALKINVKTGGCNTVLDDAINRNLPLVSEYPTIIFGADVTPPQPGEDSSSSIAAVVASMDWPYMTKYKALVSAQQHRQEIIQDLYKVEQEPGKEAVHSGMISEHLREFQRSNNEWPQRILFYRDGVSEDQFSQVLLYEMDAIRKACESVKEGYSPPVTFVVVQKRHHTRLFPTNPSETDGSGNIQPGTVVDTKICHPRGYDFYLCSHAAIQGTSRPAHYHVLLDENNFSPDQLQTLTNNLCYTYARCTTSVSVVPPVYYAHLAAARARCYVEGDGDETSDSESGIGMRKEAAPVRPLPSLCPNIQNSMFFC